MSFQRTLANEPTWLTEGAVIERLRRGGTPVLDPHVLHAGFALNPTTRAVLADMYLEYLQVGQSSDVAMIVGTPTWRANAERVAAAGLPGLEAVSHAAVELLQDVRADLGAFGARVLIAGLLGPAGDAYDPTDALGTEQAYDLHKTQAQALCDAGADLPMAATLPALSEARGLALAMGETGLPYLLSFVPRPAGTLLDGTPLGRAIDDIDAIAAPPAGYLSNCVHPTIFAEALERASVACPHVRRRMIGLQANTSRLSPEALDERPHLDEADAEEFATAMLHAREETDIRVLGGCCGTNARHMHALGARLKPVT